MQTMRTRSSSNTLVTLAAVGVGAAVMYALSSPRRRAALLAAGQTALEAGSRLASTSMERLEDMLPDGAADTAAGLASTARSATRQATAAAAGTLHQAVDRASALMQEVLARAREYPGEAERASHAGGRRMLESVEDAVESSSHRGGSGGRGALLAAAAIGAGLYAMKRAGAMDRLRAMTTGAAGEGGTIEIDKTLFIDAPVEQVFDTWADDQNFPRFMSNVESVQSLGNGRSHWTVKGPAGVRVEWDCVVCQDRPRELAWESEPGSTVQNAGRVTLTPEGSGTRATVHMSYRPPAGALGDAVASLFGANPRQEMDEDLGRMKSFIEGRRTGTSMPSSGATPLQPA